MFVIRIILVCVSWIRSLPWSSSTHQPPIYRNRGSYFPTTSSSTCHSSCRCLHLTWVNLLLYEYTPRFTYSVSSCEIICLAAILFLLINFLGRVFQRPCWRHGPPQSTSLLDYVLSWPALRKFPHSILFHGAGEALPCASGERCDLIEKEQILMNICRYHWLKGVNKQETYLSTLIWFRHLLCLLLLWTKEVYLFNNIKSNANE